MYIIPNLKGEEKLKYLRKSRTDDPLLTVAEVLEKHERMIDEWVERHQPEGGPIPEENIFREVVSGETIESRPQMKALLRKVESPKIKAIVVVEPSRLSRGDLQDIGYMVKILRYTKTIVITPSYAYDLNDERDRELFERELMRGNEFLEYQKRILGAGRRMSVEAGNFIGSHAPYGHRKVNIKVGKKICPTLEPHPDEAPIVKQIFEWYASGVGAMTICDRLDAMHVPTRTGIPWAPTTIYSILENVHNIGKVKWGERRGVRRVEDGQVILSHPKAEDFLVFEGRHPALVSQELWDAVQAKRGTLPKQKKDKGVHNPLAGVLICRCGKTLARKAEYRDKGTVPRYICPNRNCRAASVRMFEVIDKVVEVLEQTVEDFEVRIESGVDDSVDIHRQMVERLEHRLKELRDLEVKQWAEKMKHGMPDHVFEQLNGPTVAEIEDIEHALCEAKNAVPEPIDLGARLITFKAALEALKDPDAPVKEKNELVKACIEKIEYYREKPAAGKHAKPDEMPPFQLDFKLKI